MFFREIEKIVLIVFLFTTTMYSQLTSSVVRTDANPNTRQTYIKSKTDLFLSPNASTLGSFGEIPPVNYLGLAEVNVPIYQIMHNDFVWPLQLNYHSNTAGKVNVMAGSYGLGWMLTSGGMITLSRSAKTNIPSGVAVPIDFSPTSRDDWSTKENLTRLLNNVDAEGMVNAPFDINNYSDISLKTIVLNFNFNGYSGEIYFDENETPRFRSKQNVKFKIEIEQIQDHNSTIAVNDLMPYQNLDAVRSGNYQYFNPKYDDFIGRAKIKYGSIYKIKLTDVNGITYVFGGTEESIELIRPGHTAGPPYSHIFEYANPTTWNITEIIFPNKELITFSYVRGNVVYNSSQSFYWRMPTGTSAYLSGTQSDGTLVNPSYLTKISTNKESIILDYSPSIQKKTSISDLIGYVIDPNLWPLKKVFFYAYNSDVSAVDFRNLSVLPYKLDKVTVKNKQAEEVKVVKFYYTNSSDERLKLLKLDFLAKETDQTAESYLFEYSNGGGVRFPGYDSFLVDDYGYLNTKIKNTNYDLAPQDLSSKYGLMENISNSAQLRNEYYNLRVAPDNSTKEYDLLKKILYPTKGYTVFEYESNKYGSVASNYPFIVNKNQNNEEKITGGVRIKSVKNFDNNNEITKSITYSYVKDYDKGGRLSSGILTHKPIYFFGRANVKYPNSVMNHFSSTDLFPASQLRGNHITYSEVTEIDDKDNSFVTYKYKNFDNGYHDEPVINYAEAYENRLLDKDGGVFYYWNKFPGTSMELERGQLLSKTYFKTISNTLNKKGEKVKGILYEYNDDPNRFNEHIREITKEEHKVLDLGGLVDPVSFLARKIYVYTPYLTKETEIDYNGTTSIVKKETSYKYNEQYKAVVEKEEKIGDKTYKTLYQYPFDFLNQTVYNDMEKKHILAPVILEEHYVNNERVFGQKNNYARWYKSFGWKDHVPVFPSDPSIPSDPISTSQGNTLDSPVFTLANWPLLKNIEKQDKQGPWEKEVDFIAYDLKHNLLNSKDKSGFETNYIWGYNRSLPIWVIANASYSSISNLLGDKISKIASDAIPLEADIQSINTLLKQSSDLKDAFISHYLYDPVKGLIYKENERGGKEYYEYDGFGRLKKVQDGNKNTLIEYEYNYKQ